jgi:hypothetical protein
VCGFDPDTAGNELPRGFSYLVGGSMASSHHGIPRALPFTSLN